MKKLITLLCLTTICCYSQNSKKAISYNGSKKNTSEKQIELSLEDQSYSGPITFVTNKKDTLYIQDNATGRLIQASWDDTRYKGSKPVIIMTKNLQVVIDNNKKFKNIK